MRIIRKIKQTIPHLLSRASQARGGEQKRLTIISDSLGNQEHVRVLQHEELERGRRSLLSLRRVDAEMSLMND